jgi:hypothetical protein
MRAAAARTLTLVAGHVNPGSPNGSRSRSSAKRFCLRMLRGARHGVTCAHRDDRKQIHFGELLRRFTPRVAMVQAAEARHGDQVCGRERLWIYRAFVRSVLFERVVDPVLMIIGNIIAHQPEQMSFVQRDDVVQDLSPATSNPSFRGSILPGRLDIGPLRFQTRRLQERDNRGIKFRIAVQDHVMVWASFGKRLAQLLHDPLRTRMSSDIEIQNPAAPMLDHKKAVQQLERQRRHGEEIEGGNELPVILQKR